MITSSKFLLLLPLALCSASLVFGATTLPPEEVQALRDIGKTLGKKEWNFDINPCSEQASTWVTPNAVAGSENNVSCSCLIADDDFCHVVSIVLKSQNLQGRLPPELINLPYLQEIDLTRNYLNGTIPKEWGSLNLVYISLYGNRISGPIPMELANIVTLKKFDADFITLNKINLLLDLMFNQMSGNISHLGSLSNLEKLLLCSNNFTGELPETLSILTKLQQLRLSDNQFSGKIPKFIQRWKNLTDLVLQGSGLSGPIPSEISSLHNLIYLIISDLNGPDSTFPQVNNMTRLNTLILRNCNINDTIPPYLKNLSELKDIDISFNKLSGEIQTDFEGPSFEQMYLTKNFLTGPVPNWTTRPTKVKLDLSYNNFNIENSELEDCQKGNMNLFASFPRKNSGPIACVKSNGCTQMITSLYINCGGESITIGDKMYEQDESDSGPATFFKPSNNWAFSNTGHFLDAKPNNNYKAKNTTTLHMANTALYKTARISPISLTYYGFCLENGNYKVNLHFAEIMFTDNNTFESMGRRVFDIYIQGKLVMKDFNIANEAQGVGKEIIQPFDAYVNSSDLEIRFYWAGKGTTNIPYKSVYGPLISAISIEKESRNSIPISAVVGIVLTTIIVVILSIVGILWWRGCLGKKASLAKELKSLNFRTSLFTLRQIKEATNNFDISNKIGEGGFGPVYKGVLSDGTIIAVKQLSSTSKQGNREFINEIAMISALQHPYLVKLYGCCVDGDQLFLVYEYMENNSLAYALFGLKDCSIKLDWPTRYRICVGIARGLCFLHEESRLKIVHRDIKATNVLLDKDLNPKISDFGLAKLDEEDNTHISTRIAGSYGYMAPEYAMHGHLTDKADVYSFGIVALEIVSGKSNTIQQAKDQAFSLLNWAHLLKDKGNLLELVDPRLDSDFNKEEAMVMINTALLCTNVISTKRPTMSSVVSMLEGRIVVPEFILDQNEVMDHQKKLEKMQQYYAQIQKNNMSEIEGPSSSIDYHEQWIGSPSSTSDLYPIKLDSSYLEKRN